MRKFLFVLFIFLLGCSPTIVAEMVITATAVPPTPISTNTLTPLPTASPTATAVPSTAVPTQTPTPLPTATPKPIAAISVPAQWLEIAETAVAQLNRSNSNWEWQIGDLSAPIQFVMDDSGLIIKQEPLALVVPWITDWHYITQADAEAIIANGHQTVHVLPFADAPPTHKPLHVDGRSPRDPDYPFQQSWSLLAEPGYETAVAELAPYLRPPTEPIVHLAAVGDLMLGRSIGYLINQGYLDYPFLNVADQFQAADITVGNLESALGDIGEPQPKRYPFQAPPAAAQSLARAGFDIVSLANNHGMDYGAESLLQGIDLLHKEGVATIGAGANAEAARAPYIIERNGLKLAFLGYVHVPIEASTNFNTQSWEATATEPGLSWGDPQKIIEDVTAVAPQVDHVIIILHSGYEYIDPPSDEQMAAARAAIDAGATMVIGHHAHVLQGIEYYKDGVIVYGLGNFAFEIDGDPSTAILHAWLGKDGVHQIELVPAIIQIPGGQPRLAEDWEAPEIMQRVYRLTGALNLGSVWRLETGNDH